MSPDDLQLSTNFHLSEFTVSRNATVHGIRNVPLGSQIDNLRRVALTLEIVRSALGNVPISITSGFRCPALNTIDGGASDSAHLDGRAADFVAPKFGTPQQICHRIIDAGITFDQLIFEGTWVHFGLALKGQVGRGQVLTAIFVPGQKTRYVPGVLL